MRAVCTDFEKRDQRAKGILAIIYFDRYVLVLLSFIEGFSEKIGHFLYLSAHEGWVSSMINIELVIRL